MQTQGCFEGTPEPRFAANLLPPVCHGSMPQSHLKHQEFLRVLAHYRGRIIFFGPAQEGPPQVGKATLTLEQIENNSNATYLDL
jgi:hypothetical protein